MGDGVEHKGYYTKEQLRDTVAFARERGIEVIPELDIPGHTTAIIASYPELACTGEQVGVGTIPGIYSSILCPGKDSTVAFIKDLLDELCEIFNTPYFHLGGDETVKKNWANCSDCKARMDQYGLKNLEELQSWYMNQMIEYLRRKGKTVITWNDALASGMLKEDTVVQYWAEIGFRKGYTHHYVNTHKLVLSNYGNFYCDQIYAQIPLKTTYSYHPHIRSVDSLPDGNILGIEAPIWTEFIENKVKLEQMLFPRLLAVSERCWNREYHYRKFEERVRAYEEIFDLFSVNFTSFREATLHGVKAVNRLAKYMMDYTATLENCKADMEFSVPENLKDDAQTGIRAMINDPDMCTNAFKGFYKILFLLKLLPLAKKLK
jgi:hexosaminidase